MIRRVNIIFIMAVAFAFRASATPFFHVKCLANLYQALNIHLPDSLGSCLDNDTTWHYQGRPLRVCTNHLGDVSHIGYRLFDSKTIAEFRAPAILRFIERYALECHLMEKSNADQVDTKQFYVKFQEGNPSMLRDIDAASTLTYKEKEQRGFLVNIQSGRGPISLFIPADYQLLVGTDEVEQEKIFERDVQRLPSTVLPGDSFERKPHQRVSRHDSLLLVSEGFFLNEMIRSDVYYREADGKLNVQFDPSVPLRSISNLMLTGAFHRSIPLYLTVDQYGYTHQKLRITLQQLLRYFRSEGCTLYVGVKQSSPSMVKGTLFAVNKQLAYNHVVSFSCPTQVLTGSQVEIQGKAYVYIPLQNITEDLFIHPLKQ